MSSPLLLAGQPLTLEEIAEVAVSGRAAALDPTALPRIQSSRAVVDGLLRRGETAYGVNTGFGKLSDVRIEPGEVRALQQNLVRSHACGVGEPLPEEEVRAMLLLRANVLAKGFSGVRPELLEMLLALLNYRIHPIIPARGSVGASGDLAPLAHLALAIIGEGQVLSGGRQVPAAMALLQAGLKPLVLEAKEGLALLNGTQAITAVGGLALRAGLARGGAGRPGWSDDAGGAQRNADALRRADPRGAAASGPNGHRGASARVARGKRDSRVPSAQRSARAGCLLPPLHAAGARRGARCARANADDDGD